MPSDLPAPTDLPKGLREPEVIGRGGFAVVYRAVQPALHRTVAVKVLQEDLDERGRRRFTQEVGAMGALSGHPHIAQVHEAGFTDGGRACIVMPFLPGGWVAGRARASPCAPDCDAVSDELIVVGADFMEEETDAGPEPGATSPSSSSSPSEEDDEPVEDTEVPTPEPTDPVRVAILLDDNATLRTTPQITEFNIVGRIQGHEGAAVEVLGGGQDGWYEIRSANGAEGWIWGGPSCCQGSMPCCLP